MTDAAYIAARLGRAMPRAVRLRFVLYRANYCAMLDAGFDQNSAHKAALIAVKSSKIASTKDLEPTLQKTLKFWLETQSDAQIQAAASEWDRITNSQ